MQIIKSFKELTKINKKELFNRSGKLKTINKKATISIARQIADGFDDIDLRKNPTKAEIRRAQKYIKEFYENSNNEKTKLIIPNKKNRKYYGDYSGISSKFKIYAMPVIDDSDTFKLIKKKGTKKANLKRIGQFSDTEFYSFKENGISKRKLITKTKEATEQLYKEIEKDYKEGEYATKIKCGKAEYKALYTTKDPYIEIDNWINIYGAEKVQQFCLGLQVYSFKNQEQPNNILKKGEKKKKFKKNLKNIGTFKHCSKCKTKTKCKKLNKCILKNK